MESIIEITNCSEINAIYFGLIANGYEFAEIQKSDDIQKIITRIKSCILPERVNEFFAKTYQNTCSVYPYWPRAALMETATFYQSDIYNPATFDFFGYYDNVLSLTNLLEKERDNFFWDWIRQFPETLLTILKTSEFHEIDIFVKTWVAEKSIFAKEKIINFSKTMEKLYLDENKTMQPIIVIISPLKCIYSADYQFSNGKMFVTLGDFLPNSIIHECIHPIVHPYIMMFRNRILKHFGNNNFTIDKSYFLNNDEEGFVNAFEEDIVRKVSLLVSSNSTISISIDDMILDEIACS